MAFQEERRTFAPTVEQERPRYLITDQILLINMAILITTIMLITIFIFTIANTIILITITIVTTVITRQFRPIAPEQPVERKFRPVPRQQEVSTND